MSINERSEFVTAVLLKGQMFCYINRADWYVVIQGDQRVSVYLMITVQRTRKNILNSFNHLP
jgi:hypothetical protein